MGPRDFCMLLLQGPVILLWADVIGLFTLLLQGPVMIDLGLVFVGFVGQPVAAKMGNKGDGLSFSRF